MTDMTDMADKYFTPIANEEIKLPKSITGDENSFFKEEPKTPLWSEIKKQIIEKMLYDLTKRCTLEDLPYETQKRVKILIISKADDVVKSIATDTIKVARIIHSMTGE